MSGTKGTGGGAGKAGGDDAPATTSRIAFVVTSYFIISISMVFVNKWLIQGFDAPFFVTWVQCVVTAFICWLCGELGQHYGAFAHFPQQRFDWSVGRNLLKSAVVFVGMVTLNNLCLKYVEVSFYNVARSLTIVFNVIFTYIILRQTTSARVCATLAVVVVGFFVGAEGEVNFSLIGTLAGVGSSVFVSLNGIYTKEALPHVNKNDWALSFYVNALASAMFVPLIWLIEADKLAGYSYKFASPTFWGVMILSGVLGFLINIVSIAQINVTSPLTHNISGTAKACVQTVLAFFIWQNPYTAKALIGVALVIGGSMLYAYVRLTESPPKPVTAGYAPVPTSAAQASERDTSAGVEITDRDVEAQRNGSGNGNGNTRA